MLYEWWPGRRTDQELADQEVLFPPRVAVPFGIREAAIAAEIYAGLKRPRSRQIDIAIAACAVAHGASIWTLNPRDFQNISRLDVI